MLLQVDKLVNQSVLAEFRNELRKQKGVVMYDQHSSFIKTPYRRKYLREYFDRMSKTRDAVLFDDHVASILKEQGLPVVEAPRSIYRPEKLYEALERYKTGKLRIDSASESFRSGVSLAYTMFANHTGEYLKPLEFTAENIWSMTSNKAGSAGLTAWGQTKAEALLRAQARGMQTLRGRKMPEPCIAFARTQFNDKTRLVWGYPYSMTAIEGIFARPLIEHFLESRRTPLAFGVSSLELGTRLRVSGYHNKFAYSTDYSGYDATIPPLLITIAFKILRTWFDPHWIEPESGVESDVIFRLIESYFMTTPIVMPDGNLYKGKRMGIPSGSYFTQLVGSICNLIILGAVSKEFSLNVDSDDMYILGDDCLFYSNRKVNPQFIANYIQRVFGVKTNVEKSSFTEDTRSVHFLGRDWINGEPDLPLEDIVKRMVFPERFRRYSRNIADRKREVKMLFLSYAAVYRTGYQIYRKMFGPFNGWYVTNTALEVEVYGRLALNPGWEEISADHLSGYQNFLRKYVWERKVQAPSLASQFLK